MAPTPRPANRGPAASAENRAAILEAARRLFATNGLRVPLSAIAREAGVGQGVLYRHFPERLALAYAVFADNFAALEQLAASVPGPECFTLLWQQIVTETVESAAFVEMVIEARPEPSAVLSPHRFETLVAEPLARAQAAGLASPDWTPHDILLLEHMVYGVVIAHPDPAEARHAVQRALTLIDPRLSTS